MEDVLDTVWSRTLSSRDREALSASDAMPTTAETVIVGAGLVGLAVADALVESGHRDVCVVDRVGPAGEASGANAGGLWFSQQGPELGPVGELAHLSNELYSAIGERFACDLTRRGVLELLYSDEQQAGAGERLRAIQAAGFRGERLTPEDLRRVEPELAIRAGALFCPDDGQVHPTKLAAGWVRELRAAGVKICRGVEVVELGKPLRTSAGVLHAERIVLTAGAWTALLTKALGWEPPIRPVRGALLALPAGPRRLHHTVMAGRYYYWQLEDGQIAGGGSEERVGFEPGVRSETLADIRAEMGGHFPFLVRQPTEVAWHGFRPYCEDAMPVIGAAPGRDDLFVAAGHFRKGVMLAPATGAVIADLVSGREPRANITALDPARFPIAPTV